MTSSSFVVGATGLGRMIASSEMTAVTPKSSLASKSQRRARIQHHLERNSPSAGSKGRAGPGDVAHVAEADAPAEEDGQRHEAGEPERRGQDLDAEHGERVGEAGKLSRRDDEIEKREQRPRAAEEEERYRSRWHCVPVL